MNTNENIPPWEDVNGELFDEIVHDTIDEHEDLLEQMGLGDADDMLKYNLAIDFERMMED